MRSYTPDIEFTNMIEHHAKIIYKVCSLYYSPETLIEDLYQEGKDGIDCCGLYFCSDASSSFV